jgi:low affinity Fe/Cu permease
LCPYRGFQRSLWIFRQLRFECAGLALGLRRAIAVILLWAITGPFFHYYDTWQLIINTGTTIVTFMMVFLIQNTQNRDARAINLKLNELIHAVGAARNQMIDIEHLSDSDLDLLAARYEKLRSDLYKGKQPAHLDN